MTVRTNDEVFVNGELVAHMPIGSKVRLYISAVIRESIADDSLRS